MVYNAVVSHLAAIVLPHYRVNAECVINYFISCVSGLTFHYTITPLYFWIFAPGSHRCWSLCRSKGLVREILRKPTQSWCFLRCTRASCIWVSGGTVTVVKAAAFCNSFFMEAHSATAIQTSLESEIFHNFSGWGAFETHLGKQIFVKLLHKCIHDEYSSAVQRSFWLGFDLYARTRTNFLLQAITII